MPVDCKSESRRQQPENRCPAGEIYRSEPVSLDRGSTMRAAEQTKNLNAPDLPSTSLQRLLVVEDHEDTRHSMQEMLSLALHLPVDAAADGAHGLEMLTEKPYSVVITDLRMPKLNGMKLIEEIQARQISVTVIVTTGHGSVSEAVQAMRMGAYDFITKPADPQHLCLMVRRALNERALQDEVVALRQQLQADHSFQHVLSKNPRMLDVFEL